MRISPVLKKAGLVFGALFLLLLLAIVILPFVVDVDQYRPKIISLAEEKINGKLALGKLQLTLWGQIKIQVDGFALTDAQGQPVVSAKDVYFQIPLASVLAGAPELNLNLQSPEVVVVKDKKGHLNVLSLVKTEATSRTGSASAPQVAEKPTATAGSKGLPSIAVRARLGIEMRHAALSYRDAATQIDSQVKDLNVVVRDISLSHPIEMEIWANLDTRVGKDMTVRGPMRITGRIDSKFTGATFESSSITVKAGFDDLDIEKGSLFHKTKGVPANAEGTFTVTLQTATIEKLSVKFHNANLTIAGAVTGLDKKNASGESLSPEVKVTAKSGEVALKPWSDLIPMLKEFDLNGSVAFDAEVHGPANATQYRAELWMKGITAKAPTLKAEPRIDGNVLVLTDRVENLKVSVKAPGSDLQIQGKVISFSKPKIDVSVTSSGMDLDALMDFSKKTSKASPGATRSTPQDTASPTGSGKSAGATTADFDSLLDPLRENSMAAGIQATFRLQMNALKANGIKMTGIQGQASFRALAFTVENFQMGLWGGRLKSHANFQMMPKVPTYSFGADVSGMDIRQAVESQMALFKNTVLGSLTFKIDGQGASLNPEPAKGNLNARGSLRVENATFATIDVAKMASDAINKTVQGIADKYPALKGQSLKPPGDVQSKYSSVSSDFTIANGLFTAPNFFAKAEPNRGIDVKGATTLGLKDYSLKANWELIDTYNFTHARDLSVEQAGVRVEHILAEGNEPVKFPISVGGTAFAPVPSYTSVPEALGKIAVQNVSRALEGKARAEVKKQADEQIKKLTEKAPAPVQKALQNFGKKLFGN